MPQARQDPQAPSKRSISQRLNVGLVNMADKRPEDGNEGVPAQDQKMAVQSDEEIPIESSYLFSDDSEIDKEEKKDKVILADLKPRTDG